MKRQEDALESITASSRDKQDCQERVAQDLKKKKEAEVILFQVYKNYANTIQLLVSWVYDHQINLQVRNPLDFLVWYTYPVAWI